MDNVVYLDYKAKELENLQNGNMDDWLPVENIDKVKV